MKGEFFPKIMIYPEGTTKHSEYLLSFKKGAFENFYPVKPFVLKYHDNHFSPYLCTISMPALCLLLACSFKTSVDVYEFDSYYPDHLNLKNPDDWEIYADRIK